MKISYKFEKPGNMKPYYHASYHASAKPYVIVSVSFSRVWTNGKWISPYGDLAIYGLSEEEASQAMLQALIASRYLGEIEIRVADDFMFESCSLEEREIQIPAGKEYMYQKVASAHRKI